MPVIRKQPLIDKECVACGNCAKVCPLSAITISEGTIAMVNEEKCVGCGRCANACPALAISNVSGPAGKNRSKSRYWYDYLWIATPVYLALGLLNILFAWLGLIFFCTPLIIAIAGGSKAYCNQYCDRGQFFELLGGKYGMSFNIPPPRFLRSAWFRYGFLAFFMTMFFLMIYNTWLVFAGASLKEAVTLLWAFKLPWYRTNIAFAAPWAAQFAFGFFSVMLTSNLLGIVTMLLFRPRTWCVYCPMGTMTQAICKIKSKGKG